MERTSGRIRSSHRLTAGYAQQEGSAAAVEVAAAEKPARRPPNDPKAQARAAELHQPDATTGGQVTRRESIAGRMSPAALSLGAGSSRMRSSEVPVDRYGSKERDRAVLSLCWAEAELADEPES